MVSAVPDKTTTATASAQLSRLGMPLLLAVFIILGAVYAIVTPLFEVSDELWHYPMVKTLADGEGLPVQNPSNPGAWRQEGSQPPLYYFLMALATGWIDTSDINQVRWINPHADNGVITQDGNNNIVIHTYREAWPWYGTVLAVRLIRLLGVLMGAGTVYYTYRLAQESLPGQPALALAAAGFTAFTPMFVFISASVNNDNLAVLLASAALWLMARWLREGGPRSAYDLAAMGLLLGAAALSKTSALGLWPFAAAALLFAPLARVLHGVPVFARLPFRQAGERGPRYPIRLASLLLVYVPALAVSGWWFVRNALLYGDWLGWSAFLDTVGRRPHPATLLQLWGERVGFVQAYWGLFGGVSVPMPDWTYIALNSVVGFAIIGLALGVADGMRRGRIAWNTLAIWMMMGGWLGAIVYGLIRWTMLTWASQGRLIFPAISVIGVLAVAGLARLRRWLPWAAVAFMAVLTAAVPFAVIGPHYQPPPPLSAEQLAHVPNALGDGKGADFGGEMRLLGFDFSPSQVVPGETLHLTLYWQAEILMDRNWSIFVHVVDEAGVIVAQRDRYPAAGALATTLLQPGQSFADEYAIVIPDSAFAPVAATLKVGLYDLADGARLPLATGGDTQTLASVAIAARPVLSVPGLGSIPNPIRRNYANQIELAGYGMSRRSLRPGETLTVTLYWRALAPIPINYSVFAHIRGEGETLWAGQDAWPQLGAAPTSAWRQGEVVVDPYSLTLKPETPPGQHDVEVGLYDGQTGSRLQVIAADGRPTDLDFVYLSRIHVTGP
jgi:hypothetical protein